MSGDQRDPRDPTETYVLDETAITRLSSLEELAERAMGKGEDDEPASASSTDRPTDPA